MEMLPLVLPVRYREHKFGGFVHRLADTTTSIRKPSPEEAPVAILVETIGNYGKPREYRLFDGKLWTPADENSGSLAQLFPVWDRTKKQTWERPEGPYRMGDRFRDHALRHVESWTEERSEIRVKFVSDPECDAFREAETKAIAAASRGIVVGEEVLLPSLGPVLAPSERQTRHRSDVHVVDGYGYLATRLSGRISMLSAIDIDEAARDLRSRDMAFRVIGPRPDILITGGYSRDISNDIAEALAWHMVWTVREISLPDLGHAEISAIVDLRNALKARWPAMEADYRPSAIREAYPHQRGIVIPPPGPDLLAVMQSLADLGPAPVDPATVSRWRVALERITPTLADTSEDDRDALMTVAF